MTDRFFLTQNNPNMVNRYGATKTVAVRDREKISSFGQPYAKAVAWTIDLALAVRIAKLLNDDVSPQWSLETRVESLERWRREVAAANQFDVLEGG